MVTLRLNDIGTRYGNVQVVSGITTPVIQPGTVTAVIGPNAAGKSSLFKRIAGLAKGTGVVELGTKTKDRNTICYMPQDTGSTAVLTVYESIILAAKQGSSLRVKADELERIDEILAALRISNLSGRNLGELSGGQRQLVAIAQTLVRDPKILLMDEPTSALDLHRQMEVLSFMRDIAKGQNIIVLIAIHDLNHALQYCDQAMAIRDGRMVAFGPCAEVIDRDLLRDVYQVDGHVELNSLGHRHVVLRGPSDQTDSRHDTAILRNPRNETALAAQ
ncbi:MULTISPECIES: ABC transporter ATP-binding protein [Thalassospira]|uniref:Ferrichrome ABC transporter n=2 Tax=Thalassospira TaxID=168934 RepID=A0A367WE99_9PROT|nr:MULTISPECIES: ABC transporter ATP-binding protein [Thalassospira]MDG4718725.1 ABC transporter ATP-binding protein [Thalassospira sp. FZY0004]RCK39707.1 ferrichrome ABC transporter [Thalassospira profundimaris]